MNKIFALTLLALLTLSACGQKGPLYLPQPSESAGYSHHQ
ncbi:MAG: lipoprotein [Pseudomonadales bacterium]|nr:lipoprotein [Pseudomonadales bacterium]MCP5216284.1 lipoprotein [Pseudomonadales bacterium]